MRALLSSVVKSAEGASKISDCSPYESLTVAGSSNDPPFFPA